MQRIRGRVFADTGDDPGGEVMRRQAAAGRGGLSLAKNDGPNASVPTREAHWLNQAADPPLFS
jgi:hypothetical protein